MFEAKNMIKITKKLKKNNFKSVDYPIYTGVEADEEGIVYKYWQECKPGDWGISDDEYVSECISRNQYKDNTEMVYPFGRQWLGNHRKLEFEPHYSSGNFCTVSTKSYDELESQSRRAELAVDAFLAYKMAGLSPDMEKIGSLYRPDQENPIIAAKRLLKTKEAKKMIEEGESVPKFHLPDSNRKLVKSSDLKGKKHVIYFYPRDFTPGCTTEADEFSKDYNKFKKAGIEIVGISKDDVDSHRKFCDKMKIPYILLSDVDTEVSKKFGIWRKKKFMGREFMGIIRSTFLVNEKGKIFKVYPKVKPAGHSKEVLEAYADV